MLMLGGKAAIVTGAGRGIGRETAIELARHGAQVIVNDIDPANARHVVDEIHGLGKDAVAVKADVSDEQEVGEMVNTCINKFGKVDILVNNAGMVHTGPLTGISITDWDKVMAVSLKSVFLCCKAVFPAMMIQKSGKIINIASVAGKRGGGLLGNSCYAAAKGGVIAFTKTIAREGGPFGINVNAITPALTDTDMTSGLTPEQREAIIRMMPLGRAGKPQDVARAVIFLASDYAGFITGEIMDVDGGLMMD
jgi:3-oxoacyl-[acyl-carrier protein] reductase